jgi:hypothetical protein
MTTPGYDALIEVIDTKLRAVAGEMEPHPDWHNALERLTPTSTNEERLAVYQAIRRAGALPDEASFFLVSGLIGDIAAPDADDKLRDYTESLQAITEQYRLSFGGIWPPGSSPAGYDELRRQYFDAWCNIFGAKLEQFGESEMAQLLRDDKTHFDQLTALGQQYFFGGEGATKYLREAWIFDLIKEVANCIESHSPMGPLGHRYYEEDGHWPIMLFPTPVELLGGAVDGEVVVPGFSLDIEHLRSLFDQIEAVSWQSQGFPNDEGPRVSIEGIYHGHNVFLQILAYAPDDEEPRMKVDTVQRPI